MVMLGFAFGCLVVLGHSGVKIVNINQHDIGVGTGGPRPSQNFKSVLWPPHYLYSC